MWKCIFNGLKFIFRGTRADDEQSAKRILDEWQDNVFSFDGMYSYMTFILQNFEIFIFLQFFCNEIFTVKQS